jgi:hypothetical protein
MFFVHLFESGRTTDTDRDKPVLLDNVKVCEETRVIVVLLSVPNAAFSHDAFRHSVLDLSFARGSRAGELGSAPPK